MKAKEQNSKKRVLIYVHFNKNNKIADYIEYQLRHINQLFDEIIFVSNSNVSINDKKKLNGFYNNFIQRNNEGFDFAGWRDGLKSVGWKTIEKFDSLTLMNDTCFGPIYPMEEVYKKMEKSKADFWGMTDHCSTTHGMPGTNGPVPEHIQSYFMVFKRNVIKSKTFKKFWEEVTNSNDVTFVIQNYETQLTKILNNAGFEHSLFFNYGEYYVGKKNNLLGEVSFRYPKILINTKTPLIKVKSFLQNFDSLSFRNLIRYINKKTNYPTKLIKEHINNIYASREILRIRLKTLVLLTLIHTKRLLFILLKPAVWIKKRLLK